MNLSKDELRNFINLLEFLESKNTKGDDIEIDIKEVTQNIWWQSALLQPVGYEIEKTSIVKINRTDIRSYILTLDDIENIMPKTGNTYIESLASWRTKHSEMERESEAKFYFDRETYRNIRNKKRAEEAARIAQAEKELREKEEKAEALRPKITDISFLQGKPKDGVAVEFLLSNPSNQPILVKRVHITYSDGFGFVAHLISPPVYSYELAIQFASNLQPNDSINIIGTAKEPEDKWGRPITGNVTLVSGEKIGIGFSFPIYLKLATSEQGLVRLIFKHPRLLQAKSTDRKELESVVKTFQLWAKNKGRLSVIIEGDWDKPVRISISDNNFIKFLAYESTLPNKEFTKKTKKPYEKKKDVDGTFTPKHLQVFLCHSSNDKTAVGRFYDNLISDGIDAWLDKKNLIPGQNWQLEIPKAVRKSNIVIVFLSSSSVTKEGFVQKEIKIALDAADEKPDGTIFIIPAKLENCEVPERLAKFQWVDLFEKDGYDRLFKALEVRASSLDIVVNKKTRVHPK